MPAASLPDPSLLARALRVLTATPAGLITDVDGTISPIVARPEEARVLPEARRALEAMRARLALVGVVSGRGVLDVRRLVGVDGLALVGNHGLEMWDGERAAPLAEVVPWARQLARVLSDLRTRLAPLEGVLVEDKGVSASVHFRRARDPMAARLAVLAALEEAPGAADYRVEEGRAVLNLLPPLPADKGTAVRRLARDHALRGLMYLGDDTTDVHALRALRALRAEEGLETLGIAVIGAETPPGVRESADAIVSSPEAVAKLLGAIARNL